ncbi:xanthine dehydrogenase accessory factor [Oceaniovalibus guishaninsula JLT2003]|uniref:Xanthine dehydrogenase accessory factor n=1 Tax=Oceaniovalibus guishaninsula JLT2003 TaxID=1231392 RepID=K2I701_9RHOB|nr:xanthine dehydrogenase accessory protein XdhC [Oceaniovalibus guishaninsula]EKE44790.1 xanthine dehydrogenase accessory factor [Oceaniovalibus guishaninsula JLT2003]
MSFDLDAIAEAVALHGRVLRVAVAEARGSVPREPGAAMLLWDGGQAGTIGGGALEWQAAQAAREGARGVTRHPLGPSLGQCCGGAVTLWTEAWDAASLARLDTGGGIVARGPGEVPLSVARLRSRARGSGVLPAPGLHGGWMVEPLARRTRPVWIWGAGHVGRAMVAVLSPLPELALTWIDTAPARFPAAIPDGVAQLVAADPVLAVRHAPDDARHVIVTYSHALDLALCDALLSRRCGGIGLIGSATKWARFRKRLRDLGHGNADLARIDCPIGDPSLGKHPQTIAIGVAARLLDRARRADGRRAHG